jgi:hypothetical protein
MADGKGDTAMAQGLLGGILGGEKEKPELKAPETPAKAEVFAATVAARLSAIDPETQSQAPWCLQIANLRSTSGNGGRIE